MENKYSSTIGELLIKASEMKTDAERFEFFVFLHQWSGKKASVLHIKLNEPWSEPFTEEATEVITQQQEG